MQLRVSNVIRTHIRPAFQLSGTGKLTDVNGGASHLTCITLRFSYVRNSREKIHVPCREVGNGCSNV